MSIFKTVVPKVENPANIRMAPIVSQPDNSVCTSLSLKELRETRMADDNMGVTNINRPRYGKAM